MSEDEQNYEELYLKIKEISNLKKFRIIVLTQSKELTISELSDKLDLAFNKCTNYVTELEKLKLVTKRRDGKNVFVKSNIKIFDNSLILG